jgi:hypothetical protein
VTFTRSTEHFIDGFNKKVQHEKERGGPPTLPGGLAPPWLCLAAEGPLGAAEGLVPGKASMVVAGTMAPTAQQQPWDYTSVIGALHICNQSPIQT